MRHIRLEKPGRIWIEDEIEGPPGEHLIEQFCHPGDPAEALDRGRFRIGGQALLVIEEGGGEITDGGEYGWRSTAPGLKVPAQVIRVARRTVLPVRAANHVTAAMRSSTGPNDWLGDGMKR